MVRQHHQLNGCEFEQTPGDSGGQRSLASCSPWDCKESDMTHQLNTHKNQYQECQSSIAFPNLIYKPMHVVKNCWKMAGQSHNQLGSILERFQGGLRTHFVRCKQQKREIQKKRLPDNSFALAAMLLLPPLAGRPNRGQRQMREILRAWR